MELTCPTCKIVFESKRKKTYCTLSCMYKSDNYKEGIKKNAEKRKGKHYKPVLVFYCLECNEKIELTEGKARHRKTKGAGPRFCKKSCMRLWYSKRFDRFIANPETLPLPQNYDEFLTGDELECIFPSCNWKGRCLTQHVNLSHGITAEQFKEMAGFNRGTGVVVAPVSDAIAEAQKNRKDRDAITENFIKHISRPSADRAELRPEGREHLIKGHLSRRLESGCDNNVDCEQ